MPYARSKEDAEFVRKRVGFKCEKPEHIGGQWAIEPANTYGIADYSRYRLWLDKFIAGMYAERDRASKEKEPSDVTP